MDGGMCETEIVRGSRDTFLRAFHQYVRNLPEKKNKKSVLSRLDLNDPPTPESIQDAMRQMEARHAQKTSVKMMKRILRPVVSAMKDYYGVLDTVTQADPTPGLVIWGALKVVIDGLGRYFELFDKIKNEVMSLTTQLRRLALYEDLYGDSSEMQDHLFRSYVNVFRFWCRVDKECNRCSLSTLLRATASFSLKKITNITNDLKENADEIDKLAPIIEGQYAGVEREEAAAERSESKKERDESSEWRKQMQSDRILAWIGGQTFNEATLTRHQNNLNIIDSGGTCDWLIEDQTFQDWLTGSSIKPLLWLHAGPGTGKSILCSHAYRYVERLNSGPKTAIALHFFEFDAQNSAVSIARGLAGQLFAQYGCLHEDIPENIREASQKNVADLSTVLDFIRILVSNLSRTYIFFDGLDEECNTTRWKEAVKYIDFFISIADANPKSVRIWFSSQNVFPIRSKLESFPTLNIRDRIGVAVDDYISSRVPGLENPEVDQSTRDWILTELKSRAEGNFLWASLMLKVIENDASSFDEMERLVRQGLPRDLDQYYHQIFARYEATERKLASKIFALITFSRRRLRLSELREAIGIISCGDPRTLKQAYIPWRRAVEKLFAPLIETQPDPQNVDDCFCHLFHGTVRDFLLKNDSIFLQYEPNTTHLISEAVIAQACLLYLSQDKYSQFLIPKSGQWVTASGEEVSHFLVYSAKYWDKHLDEVKPTADLQNKVENLLISRNFQTTLQIQSLFVEAQFCNYVLKGHCSRHKYTKRVFPRWFVNSNAKQNVKFSEDYRRFVSEWRPFLDCGTCEDYAGVYMSCMGELDRCLWRALGPQNFLAAYPDRYNSFTLSGNRSLAMERPILYYDGVADDGNQVAVLQLFNESNANIVEESTQFLQSTWALNTGHAPSLLFRKEINASLDPGRWRVSEAGSDTYNVKPVSFSPDLSCVRIGFQLFSKQSNGEYATVNCLELDTIKQASLFEHLTSRKHILVLASRRRMHKNIEGPDRATNRKSKPERTPVSKGSRPNPASAPDDCQYCSHELPQTNGTRQASPAQSANESTSEESEIDSETSSSSSSAVSSGCDSIQESWSEGSTDVDQNGQLQGKTLSLSGEDSQTSESEGESTAESEKSEEEDSEEGPAHSYGQLLDEDESDGGDVDLENRSEDGAYQGDSDRSDAGNYSDVNEDFEYDSNDERAVKIRAFRRALSMRKTKYERGHLLIYDLEANPPKVLSEFAPTLPLMLYDSPPAIHPTKSLVLWPLYGGDILFVDFEGRSHFTLRARPTTRQTRHVSMKCNFSPCGQYMHLVSLEAQQTQPSRINQKASNKPSLMLSAFISTHRLSTRKTTRSPPMLVHRAKVSLGTTQSLNPNIMPVEVTWTPSFVYLASSNDLNFLSLIRVELFAPALNEEGRDATEAQKTVISVPKLPILLPQSAQTRKVHYFPPSNSDETTALVLIGSWASSHPGGDQTSNTNTSKEMDGGSFGSNPETVSAPIGLYVDEKKDLGGWVSSNANVEMDPKNDKGALKMKMERFAPVDDCDIEHYFFQHPPKY